MTKEEKEKKYSYEEVSNLQVSNHTAEWVKIYKKTQELWSDISSIVESEHIRPEDCDAVLDREVAPVLGKLQDFIMKGIEQSVYENLGWVDNHNRL